MVYDSVDFCSTGGTRHDICKHGIFLSKYVMRKVFIRETAIWLQHFYFQNDLQKFSYVNICQKFEGFAVVIEIFRNWPSTPHGSGISMFCWMVHEQEHTYIVAKAVYFRME
jgi:hypothetical protein